MWHELVLHGIGGRTITEAKERMSNVEFLAWVEYRRLRGSLNLGLRVEHGAAVTALSVNRANGGNASLVDFLPQRQEASNDDALATAMREWS